MCGDVSECIAFRRREHFLRQYVPVSLVQHHKTKFTAQAKSYVASAEISFAKMHVYFSFRFVFILSLETETGEKRQKSGASRKTFT